MSCQLDIFATLLLIALLRHVEHFMGEANAVELILTHTLTYNQQYPAQLIHPRTHVYTARPHLAHSPQALSLKPLRLHPLLTKLQEGTRSTTFVSTQHSLINQSIHNNGPLIIYCKHR